MIKTFHFLLKLIINLLILLIILGISWLMILSLSLNIADFIFLVCNYIYTIKINVKDNLFLSTVIENLQKPSYCEGLDLETVQKEDVQQISQQNLSKNVEQKIEVLTDSSNNTSYIGWVFFISLVLLTLYIAHNSGGADEAIHSVVKEVIQQDNLNLPLTVNTQCENNSSPSDWSVCHVDCFSPNLDVEVCRGSDPDVLKHYAQSRPR